MEFPIHVHIIPIRLKSATSLGSCCKLSHFDSTATLSATNCIEAIERFSEFTPEAKAEAVRLFCLATGLPQIKFLHLERVWRGGEA